jgi:hypothetical protein
MAAYVVDPKFHRWLASTLGEGALKGQIRERLTDREAHFILIDERKDSTGVVIRLCGVKTSSMVASAAPSGALGENNGTELKT